MLQILDCQSLFLSNNDRFFYNQNKLINYINFFFHGFIRKKTSIKLSMHQILLIQNFLKELKCLFDPKELKNLVLDKKFL